MRGALLVAWLAYLLWTSSLQPKTPAVFLAVLVPAAGALVVAARRPRPSAHLVPAPRSSLLPWIVVVVAGTGWNLLGLLGHLGEPHPTLSSLLADVMASQLARAAVLALWTWVGWRLAGKSGR